MYVQHTINIVRKTIEMVWPLKRMKSNRMTIVKLEWKAEGRRRKGKHRKNRWTE